MHIHSLYEYRSAHRGHDDERIVYTWHVESSFEFVDALVVQVSQVPQVQIGDDLIEFHFGAVGAERVASGDPSSSRVHG